MVILLIYLLSMSGFVKSNENSELSNRFLPSWSSYSSWSSCNNDYYWTFLNNSCVSTSSSTVASDSYSFNTESAYCSSYVSSGVIYLNSTGSNSLYLYRLSGASISEHPTCYWRIMNPSLTPIYLKFQKTVSNYEDIYVLYSYNSIYRIRRCPVPPVNLEESRSLKKISTKILCKKLCLWTYCELDLLIFVCFSYLNTMK